MNTSATIDFPALWSAVESQFRGSLFGIHGKKHWLQVERNALLLAERNALPAHQIVVVRLFAVLHDSQRVNDDYDKGHGQRAGVYARQIQGTLFILASDLMKKLDHACARHELGDTTLDPLIGTCWDADRLDLKRVGIQPDPDLLSTLAGKQLVGKLQP